LYSIETKSLTKSFGDLTAVNDISFSVEKGEIFGFLGPNGAGKSTTMMIFTTLLKPTSGKALIAGFDVMKDAKHVRENIGFVQQETTVDEYLTGRENLLLQAKLNHIPKNEINTRIDEVLELIELSDKQHQAVVTYSGGMRKRLTLLEAFCIIQKSCSLMNLPLDWIFKLEEKFGSILKKSILNLT